MVPRCLEKHRQVSVDCREAACDAEMWMSCLPSQAWWVAVCCCSFIQWPIQWPIRSDLFFLFSDFSKIQAGELGQKKIVCHQLGHCQQFFFFFSIQVREDAGLGQSFDSICGLYRCYHKAGDLVMELELDGRGWSCWSNKSPKILETILRSIGIICRCILETICWSILVSYTNLILEYLR